jgi:hypothetical protein
MAIDEAGAVRDRRDAVVRSHAQSYALALILHRGPLSGWASIHPNVIGALLARGWIERQPAPERGQYSYRYHLTDLGRRVAEASPAVRRWIDGWHD